MTHAGEPLIHQEYTRMALLYQERVVPRFVPIARRTVEEARLEPGQRVLDVGAGTGLATFLAAEAVGPKGEVVGLDASEGQLGIAEGLRQLRGLGQVRFTRGDATRLAFAGEFDAAISNLGIPPGFPPVLAGMHRAMRPPGRLSIAEWTSDRQDVFDDLREAIARHVVRDPPPELAALRQAVQARRGQLDAMGSAATFGQALRAAGFQQVEVRPFTHEVRFEGWRGAYGFAMSWGSREQEVRAMPAPEREALHAELAERWPGPFTARWRILHATATA
ncbi:MAG: methyltransferase domain-containing protein [Halobacteriales archaeon]|nr:methyltransferase domain-containing protein [Halobacteriales archaeon]